MRRNQKEGDPLSIAASLISDKIRQLPEFAEAKDLVIAGVAAKVAGATVEDMRAMGGFTAIIKDQVDALDNRFRKSHGSEIWRSSVVNELRSFYMEIRNSAVAKEQGNDKS